MHKALYPASFDPIHYGHIDIAQRAARLVDELIVGVYDRPNKRLLFDVQERFDLAQDSLSHIPNIRVAIYSGLTVDYAREVGAAAIIRGLRVFSDFELEFRMALANRRLAPDVEIVNLIAGEAYVHLSSSTVREIASLGGDVSTMVPLSVQHALRQRFAELNKDGDGPVYMISMTD
ncbi:MAG: pantetheine-phosphate adenylyltransferase [Anaerolineae bacterium]|nr:pantetheine-phosphate adenylyltransferase [Anaerolineae bacterium]